MLKLHRLVKRSILFFCFTVVLSGCKTTSYFKTPNDVNGKRGIIYLKDGTERAGDITIQFEAGIESKNFIELLPTGATLSDKILIRNIKEYSIDGNYYVPKNIDTYFTGIFHLLFVKRLTPEHSKINLYELHQLYKSNDTGEELYFYFVSLPVQEPYEVWNINSINLVPGFDIKMSKLVNDCPELAKKIQLKKSGYYLPYLNFGNHKKVAVFKKIIDEYNMCK
jgi:hypothetical protein